jgi:branched-chain amino acid transport system substrate-binding protein
MRAGALAAALCALAALAGCGGGNANIEAGGRVVGDAVTVYSSLPEPTRGASREMVQGQKLALYEAGGRAGAKAVNFVSVDEGSIGADDPPEVGASVTERIIRDVQVIAVIGGLRSRTAMTSVPLYNAAGILQVSPGAGYPGFTAPVAPGEPARWFPSGKRTFARVIGDDREQALALVEAAGGGPVALAVEPGPVAGALAAAVRETGRVSGDARTVIYAGEDLDRAVAFVERTRRTVVLPDALTRAGIVRRLEPGARRRAVVVSAAPPAPPAFAASYRARFGRPPGRYAVLGYEAMRQVLAAIERAGRAAGRRSRVIDAFFVAPPPPTGFTSRALSARGP